MARRKSGYAGYTVHPDGSMTWIPPGWNNTPPHQIAPPGCSEAELRQRQNEHFWRTSRNEFHSPDWPPFLLGYFKVYQLPWRCVLIDHKKGGRGASSWHATRNEAIAYGDNPF